MAVVLALDLRLTVVFVFVRDVLHAEGGRVVQKRGDLVFVRHGGVVIVVEDSGN